MRQPRLLNLLAGLSPRDRVLIALLLLALTLFVATGPYRARLRRETVRIEREIALQSAAESTATRALVALQGEEAQARVRVAQDPRRAEARVALASVLIRQRRYADAILETEAAIALAPRNPEPHVLLGEALDAQRRSDAAIEEYRRALALDPDNARALPLLAYQYVALGWNREAEDLLARALKALPNGVRLHAALGMVYFQNGNNAAAERELLAARRLAPDDPTLLGPLVQVYRQAGRYDEALRTLGEALKAAPPDRAALYVEQAQIFLDRHDPTTAIAAANQALQLDPERLKARYLRGVARKTLGQTREAVADLEYVRGHNPHIAKTLLLLGQLYAQNGRKEEGDGLIAEYNRNAAVDTFSRLTLRVAAKPGDVGAHLELGRFYLTSGRLPQAITEFKRVLELRPARAEARALLVAALREAHRDEEAQQALTQHRNPTQQQQAPPLPTRGPGKETSYDDNSSRLASGRGNVER